MCAVVFVRCFKKIGACRRRFSVLPSPGWPSSKTPSWRPEQSTSTPTQVAKRKSVIWKSWGWLCGLHSQQRQVKDFWWTSKKNGCIGYNPLIRKNTDFEKHNFIYDLANIKVGQDIFGFNDPSFDSFNNKYGYPCLTHDR